MTPASAGDSSNGLRVIGAGNQKPKSVQAAGSEPLAGCGGNSCRHALLRCNAADGKG